MTTGAPIAVSSAFTSFGNKRGTEQKSLMTLVAIASTLFDQQAAMEKKCMAREQQQECGTIPARNLPQQQQQEEEQAVLPPQQALSSSRGILQPQPKPNAAMHNNNTATKEHPKSMSNRGQNKRNNKNNNKKQSILPQINNFQCCTREGFLSKLYSVLNNDSHSHALSWMPDGKSFTIVSSREFSKSGLVYDLFGIRKMSSFLRRLNQLGFARVRDATDPNNLDVFRKPGFAAERVVQSTEKVREQSRTVTNSTVAVQSRLESPTSTLMFSPTALASTNDQSVKKLSNSSNPLNLPSSESSFVSVPSTTSSPVDLSSSKNESESHKRIVSSGSSSSLSTTQSSWVCSTPELGESHTQATGLGPAPSETNSSSSSSSNNNNNNNNRKENTQSHPLPRTPTSMPPPIPICPSGGPVLLRARSESYEWSPPPTLIATKPQLPPQLVSSPHKTPITTNRIPLKLSPGISQILQLPNLEDASVSKANDDIRPPPLEFVADCVQRLAKDHSSEGPTPMQVDEEFQDEMNENDMSRPKSPFLGSIHVRAFPKLQHAREYIRLCEAAEKEADAILNSPSGSLVESEAMKDSPSSASSGTNIHVNCDTSVLAHVELLQGYKRRKAYEMSAE